MRRNAKQKSRTVATPRTATTNAKVCAMPRDNWTFGEYWLLVNEEGATIAKQLPGKRAEWYHTIPRRVFNRIVDAYSTGRPHKQRSRPSSSESPRP